MPNDYPVYPIYTVKAEWPQEGEYCHNGKNGFTSTTMLRKPCATEIAARCMNLQAEMAEKHGLDAEDVHVEIISVRFEEWCCSWFGHWTFDLGLSDADVLASFEEYVWRIQQHNKDNPRFIVSDDGTKFYHDDICLMGAEDRWRWTARAEGTSAIGCGEQTGKPPCRCDGCKRNGVVRIDH
jgi:hypothetical protein